MKTMVSGSGDHGEDSRPTWHKVSGSSLATNRFIGSKSILICDIALPYLGLTVVRLFFLTLPWWPQRTMDDGSSRHNFLQG
jgi:hypothetical protein